jgi:hypothetical protein
MDLRYSTPLEDMGVCDEPVRFGSFAVENALRVAPGNPKRSMLLARIRTRSFLQMPPVGLLTHDPDGAALIEEWIKQLRCNSPRAKH